MRTALQDALHDQYGSLRVFIAQAGTATDLTAAEGMIRLVEPVWSAEGMVKQLLTVRRELLERTSRLLSAQRAYLSELRRNDRIRAACEVEVAALQEFLKKVL